jgi:hypothetical protein
MALDATFWIDTPDSPADIQALLVTQCGFLTIDDLGAAKRATGEGIVAFVSAEKTDGGYLEDAGIRARRKIYFSCSDKDNSAEWTRNVFRAVNALLHAFGGDALLIYAPDYPTLLRKKGDLVLDERRGLWSLDVEPQILPLIDLPFRFGIIPST